MMLQKFPKKEKLTNFKQIDELFSKGKNVVSFPLKILFLLNANENELQKIKIGFAVSKKRFKLAVTRNLIKRRMREAYRKNKPLFLLNNYSIMLVYTSNKVEVYTTIETKLKEGFNKIKLLETH